MPNTFLVVTYPYTANGISVVASASAWAFGSWVTLVSTTRETSFLQWFTFQYTITGTADTTFEVLFEIGIGALGDEYTIAQIPFSFRPDNLTGHYMNGTLKFFFPEVIYIPPGERIAVRAANSTAVANTFNGVKIGYQNDKGVYPGLPAHKINPLMTVEGNHDLSVNIGR